MAKKDNTEDTSPLIDVTNDVDSANIKWPPCRHVLVFMAFLGFVNVYALRVNLSVAIVSMVNRSEPETNHTVIDECPGQDNNNTSHDNSQDGEFNWDANVQGLVLGSFFYGYIFTQIPGGWLAERYGGKKLFGFGVLCTAVFTLVTPLAARIHVNLLVATRILEGLGEGVTFPAMHAMLSRWAPLYERSKLGTFAYAGAQFGTVVSLPISGLLCEYGFAGGWPSVFYVFGTCGVIWFIFWMLLIHDTPAQHPRISPAERAFIETSIGHSSEEKLPTAWGSIFTSVPVYAIIVAHFCNNWGFYTLLTTLPTYMKEVLHFDISQNGFLSALPYLAMWIMINVAGHVADTLRFRGIMSTTAVRKTFNTLGAVLPAIFLVIVGYLGCEAPLAIAAVVLSMGSQGFTAAGYTFNHIDIAPPFAGLVIPAIFLVMVGYLGCDTGLAIGAVVLSLTFQGFSSSGFGFNHIDIAPPFAGLCLPAIFLVAIGFVHCNSRLAIILVVAALGSQGLTFGGFNLNHIDIAPPFAGAIIPAICLVVASYVGCNHVAAVTAVTLAVGFGGCALSGYQVNHLDIAPPFAGTLMGISNMVATIPGFAGPQVVGYFTSDNPSASQWRIVFFISAAVYVFGAIVFLIFASGVEQPWAKARPPIDADDWINPPERRGEESDDEILNFRRQAAVQ